MLRLHHSSAFDLFDRLEQQLRATQTEATGQNQVIMDRTPNAEVMETADAYHIVLELPGVEKDAIDVKASDQSLVISAQHHSTNPPADSSESDNNAVDRQPESIILMSEISSRNWSRTFEFPIVIDREQLQANYRDGLLTLHIPKANKLTNVQIKVEG